MRIVVLGPGAAGKSTFARKLSEATGIGCVELDKVFWRADLTPTPPDRWVTVQHDLTEGASWILDGDLGPYDVLDVRLARADTVVLFDLGTWRCAWRAARRSWERLDFWRWVLTWRRRYRPRILDAIAEHAHVAEVIVISHPRDVQPTLDRLGVPTPAASEAPDPEPDPEPGT